MLINIIIIKLNIILFFFKAFSNKASIYLFFFYVETYYQFNIIIKYIN